MHYESAEKNLARFQSYLVTLGYLSLLVTAFVVPISITATNVFMTVTAGLAILSGQFYKAFDKIRSNPLTLCILLILAVVIVGMFWSIGSWNERLAGLHKYMKLLYIPFLMSFCMDEKWCGRTISAFLSAIIITVFYSFFKAYCGSAADVASATWVFHSHIETSYFVAFSAYICANRAWENHNYRWLNCFLLLIFTYQEFIINDGRTGWVVFFCLTLLFFIQRAKFKSSNNGKLAWKTHIKPILRGISLGIGFLIFLSIISYYFSPIFHANANHFFSNSFLLHETTNKGSVHLRLNFYQFGIKLLHMHPITGLGTGSLPEAYRKSAGIDGWGPNLTSIHNEYLHMLVQLGIIGLFALLYFFYKQWQMSFQLGNFKHIAQALVLSFMIASLFNTFLYSTVTGHFYVLFTSLLFAIF